MPRLSLLWVGLLASCTGGVQLDTSPSPSTDFPTLVDAPAPVILTGSVLDVTATSATVVFTTESASFGFVEYGKDFEYRTPRSRDSSTEHRFDLSSLDPETLHKVRLHAINAAEEEATLEIESFTTGAIVASIPLNTCGVALNEKNAYYKLENDVESSGTCFIIGAENVTLDLQGHSIRYGTEPDATPAQFNGGFETGSGSNPTGWDLTRAPLVQRSAGSYDEKTLYAGSYAARVQLSPQAQVLRSTVPAHMKARVTYALQVIFINDVASDITTETYLTDATGARVMGTEYAECATPGQREIAGSRVGKCERGACMAATRFSLATDTDLFVEVSVSGSQTQGNIYLDEVRITPAYLYGVAVPPGWCTAWFPNTPAPAGSATNATIKNGTILQGNPNLHASHAIVAREKNGLTVLNTASVVSGVDTRNIFASYVKRPRISNNTFTNLTTHVRSRDQGMGAVEVNWDGTSDLPAIIDSNHLIDTPQFGLRILGGSGGVSDVFHNQIEGSTIVTQGFAIAAHTEEARIYDNTIRMTNGRGIHVLRNNTQIFNNDIDVAEGSNQEYGLMTTYGVQFEKEGTANPKGARVHRNRILARTHAHEGSGTSIRFSELNAQSTDNEIYLNTLIAERNPAHGSSRRASNLSLSGSDLAGVSFHHNTLLSNDDFIRSASGNNLTATNCTFRLTDPAAISPRLFTATNWPADATSRGHRFINAVLEGGITFDHFFFDPTWSKFSDFSVLWPVTIRVLDPEGAPVTSGILVITDMNGATVFQADLRAESISVPLTEFIQDFAGKQIANSYTATISSEGRTVSRSFVVSGPMSVEVQY